MIVVVLLSLVGHEDLVCRQGVEDFVGRQLVAHLRPVGLDQGLC